MKQHFILSSLAILILSQTVSAQTEKTTPKETLFGLQGSPTAYLPTWKLNSQMQKIEPVIGYMAGISFQYNFSKRFVLHTELNLEKIGYRNVSKYNGDIIFFNDVFIQNQFLIPTDSKVIREYISAPISIKYNMIKRKNVSFFLNIGTYLSNFFSEDIIYSNHVTGEVIRSNHFDRKEKYVGGLAGLGINWQLLKKFHLTVEARDYFFNRYLHETDPNFELSAHSFRLIGGLTYQLNK